MYTGGTMSTLGLDPGVKRHSTSRLGRVFFSLYFGPPTYLKATLTDGIETSIYGS